jgi:hypothetical protein
VADHYGARLAAEYSEPHGDPAAETATVALPRAADPVARGLMSIAKQLIADRQRDLEELRHRDQVRQIDGREIEGVSAAARGPRQAGGRTTASR